MCDEILIDLTMAANLLIISYGSLAEAYTAWM